MDYIFILSYQIFLQQKLRFINKLFGICTYYGIYFCKANLIDITCWRN